MAENFLEWGERTGLARWIVIDCATGERVSRFWTAFGWTNFFRVETCGRTTIFDASREVEFPRCYMRL